MSYGSPQLADIACMTGPNVDRLSFPAEPHLSCPGELRAVERPSPVGRRGGCTSGPCFGRSVTTLRGCQARRAGQCRLASSGNEVATCVLQVKRHDLHNNRMRVEDSSKVANIVSQMLQQHDSRPSQIR